MVYDNNGAERWGPVVSEVASRMCEVRDALMDTASSPPLDWFTPLTVIESMDAALWDRAGRSRGDLVTLSPAELGIVAQTVVESLDAMLDATSRLIGPGWQASRKGA